MACLGSPDMANKPKAFTELDSEGNPTYHTRAEPIRSNELLYDKDGYVVAIESKGRLLAILEGEE